MQHAIICIILVFNLITHISNVFSLQNLFKCIVMKFISFLIIIHASPCENFFLQKPDADL